MLDQGAAQSINGYCRECRLIIEPVEEVEPERSIAIFPDWFLPSEYKKVNVNGLVGLSGQ
ncbi:hypothetical protein [Endozoicomonas numazuensis]|uniref:hypothetical protein n=1 Tax=Endozoicomonas numazuensis TaxID=1137799 RepID=UPI000AC1E8EC|nr:hypothetical protein [Endozoicomonas numazuensis]